MTGQQHPGPGIFADADPGYLHQVRFVTVVGLIVNLLLTAVKFAGGILGASQAVVADAVHSLSDIWTDVAVLVGVKLWTAPADADHPHGHRRIETLVTLFIGVALAAVAFSLIYNAIVTLPMEHKQTPTLIALSAALISIVSKELLYRWTVAVGRRIKSQAMVANAWHHRSDALSSVPAAIAVGVVLAMPSWILADHIGAVVVSMFILHAAWTIIKPALGQLIDVGAPVEDIDRIKEIVLGTEGVVLVHAIRTRYSGPCLCVDLHIHVPGDMTVRQGHDISEEVKRRLVADGPEVIDVVVHLEPCRDGD